MTIDEQFNIISNKLQQMLKRYQRLQKENAELKTALQNAGTIEQQSQQKIEELRQQSAILKMAAGSLSEKDKKDFERKINQYVKEIDRCIAYLSQ